MVIQRVTLFKVVDEANVQPMLDAYKTLSETNEKVTRLKDSTIVSDNILIPFLGRQAIHSRSQDWALTLWRARKRLYICGYDSIQEHGRYEILR